MLGRVDQLIEGQPARPLAAPGLALDAQPGVDRPSIQRWYDVLYPEPVFLSAGYASDWAVSRCGSFQLGRTKWQV